MRLSKFNCLFIATFMTMEPMNSNSLLDTAKQQLSVSDKIAALREFIRTSPSALQAADAREQLQTLLMSSNRFEEALQTYREGQPVSGPTSSVDLKLVDYLLRTGHYAEVLQATSEAPGSVHDFLRDQKILELRVQAFLARGYYRIARQCIDRWLESYERDGAVGGRFEGEVRSIQFLRRHLMTLEREVGPKGKSIFTASVPDTFTHWSHEQGVPIYFYKLIPSHPGGQLHEPLVPGRHVAEDFFADQVDSLNRGFSYLSQGQFSLCFKGMDTLYVKEGDLDPEAYGGSLLTSRVYVHTLPELYRHAGEAFSILVDYRDQADDEAAYMGDGIIHISAGKFKTMILMHEILHGLGATHQDWDALEKQGYHFDSEDRGLMTFDHGELRDLGLEEKNRLLLGWPQVSDIHLKEPAAADPGNNSPILAFAAPNL